MKAIEDGFKLSREKEKRLKPLTELINSSSAIEIKDKIEKSLIGFYYYSEQATLKREVVSFEMEAKTIDELVCENLWLELREMKAVSLIIHNKIDSKYAFNSSSPFNDYFSPGDEFFLWEVPSPTINIHSVFYLHENNHPTEDDIRTVQYRVHGNSLDLICPKHQKTKISITAPRLNILSKLVPEFSSNNKVIDSIPKSQVVDVINEGIEGSYKGISEVFPKKRDNGFDYSILYKKNKDGSISKGLFFENAILKEIK